jgi:hypothetical protein
VRLIVSGKLSRTVIEGMRGIEKGTMAEEGSDPKRYEIAILQVRYEGQLLWQRFGAFFIPHGIFLGFLLGEAFDPTLPRSGVFLTSLIGIILCVPWLAVLKRSSAYYTFRIAQAREIEPPGWDLLAGKGERFSAGECVVVRDHHKMPRLARILRTERAGVLLVYMFGFIYLRIAAFTNPWYGKAIAEILGL